MICCILPTSLPGPPNDARTPPEKQRCLIATACGATDGTVDAGSARASGKVLLASKTVRSRRGCLVAEPDRVVLCGGAYSDNLGDAIIADCLAYGLSQRLPETQIVKMDISGRSGYDQAGFGPKGRAQTLLTILPKPIGRYFILLAGSLYVKRIIEPSWRGILTRRDVIIIGGGQLFQDEDLNFPLKMWWLRRNIRSQAAKVVVYSVGVSRNWSSLGRMLFRPVLHDASLAYCSVRDDASKLNLVTHLPGVKMGSIHVDPDPALLANVVYEPETNATTKEFDVGIGIMHPRTLRIDPRQTDASAPSITRRWRELIRALLDRNLRVALFTNGAREDEEYMERLARELHRDARLAVLERPGSPAGFVANISRASSIIAHRLHASIVAYALGIPSLGLRWDPKVESFYAMCDRDEWIVDFGTTATTELAEIAHELGKASVDAGVRASVLGQCDAGVARLASHVSGLG